VVTLHRDKGKFKVDKLSLEIDILAIGGKYEISLYFFLQFFFMASSSNLGPTQRLILLGKNYKFWSLRMRSFLQAQECWDLVDLGYVEPDPAALCAMTNPQRIAQATLRNKKNKEKLWIQNSVDDSIFSKITGDGTSKHAWDILKSSYQGNDRIKTVKL
jgi:hypothetical protein